MTSRATWDDPLVKSARKWLDEALTGWAAGDHAKVVTLAPIAVEHLGKAALWRINPVLLAVLDKRHASSFLMLATAPDLSEERLRTIGLSDVLDRLSHALQAALPIDRKRRTRLIECRGGAIHVGQFSPDNARHILTDVLTTCQWLGHHMGISSGVLFGVHSATTQQLLDERRTATERSVDRRLAAARLAIQRLAASMGSELLGEAIAHKEAHASDALPSLLTVASVGVKQQCPGCHQRGILLGELETEPVVDVEWNPDGDEYNVGYDYHLIPDAFYCHVCGLVLNDIEELGIADLPVTKFRIDDDEVSDELQEYARQESAWNDFAES